MLLGGAMDELQFINMLGTDWKKTGHLYRITCPFHNDSRPSLVVYPQDRGYCCYSCSKTGTWMELYKTIKNCEWREAYEALGVEGEYEPKPKTLKFEFVEDDDLSMVLEIRRRYEKCLPLDNLLARPAVEFLEKKKLLEPAKKLGWRWDTGNFRQSGNGALVIPYYDGDEIMTCRLRTLNPDGSLSKPKTLKGTKARPYPLLRDTDKLYIVEGESDALSLYASGCSVVAVPGAGQKRCINSAVLYAKTGYKTIVACGDNDGPGQMMNDLVKIAARNLTSADFEVLKLCGFNDINDAFVAGGLDLSMTISDMFPNATELTGFEKYYALFQFADSEEKLAICSDMFAEAAEKNQEDEKFLSNLYTEDFGEMKTVWD